MGRIVKATMVDRAEPPAGGAGSDRLQTDPAEVTSILASARVLANAEIEAAKDTALLLARKLAERIVGRAVELDPAVMGDIVAQALAALRSRPPAALLRVHPDDLAAVQETRADWLRALAGKAEVRLVADPSVGRYGCVVDTKAGRLDARLDSQLDALEAVLRKSGMGAKGSPRV